MISLYPILLLYNLDFHCRFSFLKRTLFTGNNSLHFPVILRTYFLKGELRYNNKYDPYHFKEFFKHAYVKNILLCCTFCSINQTFFLEKTRRFSMTRLTEDQQRNWIKNTR